MTMLSGRIDNLQKVRFLRLYYCHRFAISEIKFGLGRKNSNVLGHRLLNNSQYFPKRFPVSKNVLVLHQYTSSASSHAHTQKIIEN